MKIANTAVLALLASSTMAATTPITPVQDLTLVKKDTVTDLLALLKDLQDLEIKRDSALGDEKLELSRRADNALSNFLVAFINSGIIGDIFTTLANDSTFRSQLVSIASAIFSAIASDILPLLESIISSGLIGQIWNDFINDSDLTSATLAFAESVLSWVISLFTGGSTSTTSSAASAKARRDYDNIILQARSFDQIMADTTDEFLTKRDLVDIISSIFSWISSSGIVSSFFSSITSNPQQWLGYIEDIWGIVKTVFGWAQSSGIISGIFSWLESNTSGFINTIISFIGSILGATSTTSTTTTGTTTAAIAALTATTTGLGVGGATTTTTTSSTTVSVPYTTATLVKKRRAY